jgi:hypothetical protein
MKTHKKLYRLPDLVKRLSQEDEARFVFRGQSRIWPGPLVPSGYRGTLSESPYTAFSAEWRLRETGETFYLQDAERTVESFSRQKTLLQLTEYFMGIYGYPIAQILMQQFGYSSEGLDVTTDPMVAAFFGKFDFETKEFIKSTEEPGVIYRWPVDNSPLNLETLQYMDFYSCRNYMDGAQSLMPIATDETTYWHPELLGNCVSSYIYEVNCNWDRGEPRPFEVLSLPHAIFYHGRIAHQRGGLLFPDMLLCEGYLSDEYSPRVKCCLPGTLNAVEDIATRPGIERFLFLHDASDKKIFESEPESFFPKMGDDPFAFILLQTLSYPENIPTLVRGSWGDWLTSEIPPYYDPFQTA